MNKIFTIISVLIISSCATIEEYKVLPNDPDFAPILPEMDDEPIVATGSLFKASYVNNIYSDSKAHRVGDIISVILSEKTQAKKNAKKLSSAKVYSSEIFKSAIREMQKFRGLAEPRKFLPSITVIRKNFKTLFETKF